jgi:hypothetical protein
MLIFIPKHPPSILGRAALITSPIMDVTSVSAEHAAEGSVVLRGYVGSEDSSPWSRASKPYSVCRAGRYRLPMGALSRRFVALHPLQSRPVRRGLSTGHAQHNTISRLIKEDPRYSRQSYSVPIKPELDGVSLPGADDACTLSPFIACLSGSPLARGNVN